MRNSASSIVPHAIKDKEDGNGKEDLIISAAEIQQQYYEAMGDADWELYEKKDRKHLLQKVAIAICGSPSKEGNLMGKESESELINKEDLKLQGYGVREEEICMTVFNKICEQAKYSHNGENVFISILRIVLVTPVDAGLFKKNPIDHWDNLHLKKGTDVVTICVFHLFCVRKCISMKSGVKSCRIYIDHDGRVYKNWQSYLKDNLLPNGMMVVPENGEYRGSITIREMKDDEDMDCEMPKVKLTVTPSPAMGIGARVLEATDITSTVANIGALATLIGAAFATPVVAPVLVAGAVGTGVVTGVYAIVRSSIHLADRGQHEQSIGLNNSEARGSWINIIMSTVGISFSAAAKIVAWAASSGTNIKILVNALQFLRYTNMATGVVGVANNLGDMIHKYAKYDETPSGLEIFQFTTSLLFLGIGVMSNATAQEIVQDAQASTINEARDALSSNAKRKAFDKVTAENRRTLGTINGNAETIRALKVITDKDDFFAKLARMNKDMNKNKVRVSITSDGKTLINNKHEISLSKLYGMGKGGRNKLFTKLGHADTSVKNAPTRLYVSTYGSRSSTFIASSIKISVGVEELIRITQFLAKLSQADKDFVAELLSQLSADIHDAFLFVCIELVSKLAPGDSHFKARVIYFVFDYIKSKVPDCDYENDNAVGLVLKAWIKNGRVDKEIILMLMNKFMEKFSERSRIGTFHSDPQNYDYIYEFRQRYKKFMTLQAGEEISIGSHHIIVKANTIEMLEECLEQYSQEDCDIIIEFTFKVISLLTAEGIYSLNLINPDDDIIRRVVQYLCCEDVIAKLLFEFQENGTLPHSVAVNTTKDLLRWRSRQNLRKHITCDTCSGIFFD